MDADLSHPPEKIPEMVARSKLAPMSPSGHGSPKADPPPMTGVYFAGSTVAWPPFWRSR